MWKVTGYTKTGERNRKSGLKCQDCACYMENEEEGIYVITTIQGELYDLCEKYNVGLEKLHSTLMGLAVDAYAAVYHQYTERRDGRSI